MKRVMLEQRQRTIFEGDASAMSARSSHSGRGTPAKRRRWHPRQPPCETAAADTTAPRRRVEVSSCHRPAPQEIRQRPLLKTGTAAASLSMLLLLSRRRRHCCCSALRPSPPCYRLTSCWAFFSHHRCRYCHRRVARRATLRIGYRTSRWPCDKQPRNDDTTPLRRRAPTPSPHHLTCVRGFMYVCAC